MIALSQQYSTVQYLATAGSRPLSQLNTQRYLVFLYYRSTNYVVDAGGEEE